MTFRCIFNYFKQGQIDYLKCCLSFLQIFSPSHCSSIGNRVVVDKPTIEKPSMTLMGKEDQINAMLIKLYNFLKTVCSADDLSRIDTHLLFTYMNYEELRYDEKNLQLFRATFPEVSDALNCQIFLDFSHFFMNNSIF